MSNYRGWGKHPQTGEIEPCEWLDDYFGHHRYGARFGDGSVYPDVIEPQGRIVAICRKCCRPADDDCDNAGHPYRYVEE